MAKFYKIVVVFVVALVIVNARPQSDESKNNEVLGSFGTETTVTKKSIETTVTTTPTSQPVESRITDAQIDTTTPPSRPGNYLMRFIDDIFQIPISVLQSVSKALSGPFTRRAKEDSVTQADS